VRVAFFGWSGYLSLSEFVKETYYLLYLSGFSLRYISPSLAILRKIYDVCFLGKSKIQWRSLNLYGCVI
jgi:hypothetical protein